jgi:serine/threonine protein kinase
MIGHTLKHRYEILETLAQGASGAVYKARDTALNRDVSLKVLPKLSDEARERFFQQAKTAAQLDHPNIAAVYDYDTDDDGAPFVVSEYVEGQALSDMVPSPLQVVVQIGQQIAAALEYAHEHGVVHADLTPAGIRITPSGQAKILDLGLSFTATSSTVTATGALIGSPAYLSPEQVQGLNPDSRSDIYSLGVVLYEMATGQPPFQGDVMSVLMRQVTQQPAPPHTLAPDIPADLEETILKALEKDPARRYSSAAALAEELRGVSGRRQLQADAPPLADAEQPDWLFETPPAPLPAAPPPPPAPAPAEQRESEAPPPPQSAPGPARPGAAAPPPPAPAQPAPALEQREDYGRERAEDKPVLPQPTAQAQPVQFSAYYPKEVKPGAWQPLAAYVFKQSAEKTVSEDVNRQLGERVSVFRKIVQTAKQIIREGELITATPVVPGLQFNPPSVSVAFFEDWHRFDFKLRAHTAPLNQSANGLLTFTVAGVIVADIPLSIFVGESASESEQASASSKPYQAIFCSYSHRDTQIVERVERAYKALGLDYLRDVVSLKSGTHWSEELLQLIEKADIFQLFWSEAAAQSDYVQQEWQYALRLNRDQAHFIRPVYWRQPMPPPPPDMSHIHFAYQPDLEK